MKKEWLLLISITAVTIGIALLGIRYFAPQLLGIPIDLQTVQVSEEVPPFFDNVFRYEDYNSNEFLIKDPYSRVRAKPLMGRTVSVGPHDLLGFRNHSIPNVADIVVIGDSQTYGNNAMLETNWPSRMNVFLNSQMIVYAMATGGWGGIQYLDMVSKSTVLRPRLVIVAFYSGNDPSETFSLVYAAGDNKWQGLKVDPDTPTNDRPAFVGFPSPAEKNWPVEFKDGLKTVFTPELRLISNDTGYAVVRESWDIMEKVASNMGRITRSVGAKLIITMIPTKELVYLKRLQSEDIPLDPVYEKLVRMEQDNITRFFQHLESDDNIVPVDIIPRLQEAALAPAWLYPADENGHPTDGGYEAIGRIVADAVNSVSRKPEFELRKVEVEGYPDLYLLFRDNRLFVFRSKEVVVANGWDPSEAADIKLRDFSKPVYAIIGSADRDRFGPRPSESNSRP